MAKGRKNSGSQTTSFATGLEVTLSDSLVELIAKEMDQCCAECNGRRCPVENRCFNFFVSLRVDYRTFEKKREAFARIKRAKDAKLLKLFQSP